MEPLLLANNYDYEKRAPRTIYILANRNHASLLLVDSEKRFSILEKLENRSGSKRERDFGSDKPGRAFTSGSQGSMRHSMGDKDLHHELSARRFARRVAEALYQETHDHPVKEIVLVAESHFLGLLRSAMPRSLARIPIAEIPKDFRDEIAQPTEDLFKKLA